MDPLKVLYLACATIFGLCLYLLRAKAPRRAFERGTGTTELRRALYPICVTITGFGMLILSYMLFARWTAS